MRTAVFMTMAAAALALAGCSNGENEEIDNWNGEIRLGSGLIVQQARSNNGDVPDKQIAEGQTVKVFVTKKSSDTGTAYSGYTQEMTADGSGGLTGGTSMFYPESGEGVNIRAYHPADAGTTFTVKTDQSGNDDKDYFASDLLYSASQDYARQKEAHSLSFNHQLCKLTYGLTQGDGTPSLTNAKVQWLNVATACSFDTSTGVVSATADGSKAISSVTPHSTYGAVVVPQTVTSGTKMLQVTLADGGILTYTPDADQVLDGGNVYNYTITVNLTGLKVTSAITPWTSVSKSGTATME